jgi:dolichol-phosphate mannosyltransferase
VGSTSISKRQDMLPIIVIPTYNEKENIERMTRCLMGMDIGVSILIVDDNSPDGTGEIADALAEEFEKVCVLHREGKEGLGQAYRHGFKVALDMGADYIMQMDADFSHDPKYVADMLEAVKTHDVVIGSRYVPGGGTVNWSLARKVISRGGGTYARAVTGMKIMDPTAGFRCYRAQVIRDIDFSRISASGYGFQVELSYVCTIMGFDVFEIPIVFADREEGTSKMSKNIVWEAMWLVWGLRRKYRDISNKKP